VRLPPTPGLTCRSTGNSREAVVVRRAPLRRERPELREVLTGRAFGRVWLTTKGSRARRAVSLSSIPARTTPPRALTVAAIPVVGSANQDVPHLR